MDLTVNLILILVLILINAIFAGSETALVASNESKVKNDIENGNKKAVLTLKFIEMPTNFLSTIQVGITFIGFVNGFLAADAFTVPLLNLIGGEQMVASSLWQTVAKIVITIFLTYLQVVFGELIPKKIAIQNPEKFIYRTVGTLNIINKVMRPLVIILTKSANGFAKLLGIKQEKEEMTEDEIRMLLNGSGDAIKEGEKVMIGKVLDFDDQIVSDVMTHRTEMFALNIDTPYLEMIEALKREKYSRVPVYENSLDNIVGILHTKDLLNFVFSDTKLTIKAIMRKPHFVPEAMKTGELFKEMQKNKSHMSIVVDEYGGTSGVVTIEDLLEEIVGNIFDEYDDIEEEVVILDENTYVIDGLASIDDVESVIDAGLPVDEYDTLSGFILGNIGHFPEENEKIVFSYNNFSYEVLSYSERLIDKVKVTRILDEEKSGLDD